MSELFPEGVANVRDLPYRLFDAIRMALVFIGFDELPKDERPPRKIWLDEEKLNSWFAEVEAKRKRESEGKHTEMEGESVHNKAAEQLIHG